MDVAAKLAEANIHRVAVVDDDLSPRITQVDLESFGVAALLNDQMDPDREAYWQLLVDQGYEPDSLDDPAEPLAQEAIRNLAPKRLRDAAEAALAARVEYAEPVERVVDLLVELGIDPGSVDRYSTPEIPPGVSYDLLIVDYFLVDTQTIKTLPFIRQVLDTNQNPPNPLQVILMSSHNQQLVNDFKTIRPELKVSSSRVRIMEKPRTDAHVTAWKSMLFQLASDRGQLLALEGFLRDTGETLKQAATSIAQKLWEMDLQAIDLLHELASKDHVDFTRYVEDAISRRLLSRLEEDGGMRPSLQELDSTLLVHRSSSLLAPTAEISDSRAAIRSLMHSMQWRAGAPTLPEFPHNKRILERSRWIRKNLGFGMVLQDPNGEEWLNITQACDLAQAKDDSIGQTTITFVHGLRTFPTLPPSGNYYVSMDAMMATSDTRVLTWNLRDLHTESIESFSKNFRRGWKIIGELRPDVAQSIATAYGARAARVGLPRTLSTWGITGVAVRADVLRDANAEGLLAGLVLEGHAIMRATSSSHELHLGQASIQALLDQHGDVFDGAVLSLMTGLKLKPKKREIRGQSAIVYSMKQPSNFAEAREALQSPQWLQGGGIAIFLWVAS